MVFIIGGYAQGKLDYARHNYDLKRIGNAKDMEIDVLREADCIYNFHLLVKKWIRDGKDYVKETDRVLTEWNCKVIISDEIGYGIVPLDAFERSYREAVGRASCIVAKRAEHVIRVMCGIGQCIK